MTTEELVAYELGRLAALEEAARLAEKHFVITGKDIATEIRSLK